MWWLRYFQKGTRSLKSLCVALGEAGAFSVLWGNNVQDSVVLLQFILTQKQVLWDFALGKQVIRNWAAERDVLQEMILS